MVCATAVDPSIAFDKNVPTVEVEVVTVRKNGLVCKMLPPSPAAATKASTIEAEEDAKRIKRRDANQEKMLRAEIKMLHAAIKTWDQAMLIADNETKTAQIQTLLAEKETWLADNKALLAQVARQIQTQVDQVAAAGLHARVKAQVAELLVAQANTLLKG
jgi:hypothetical protein